MLGPVQYNASELAERQRQNLQWDIQRKPHSASFKTGTVLGTSALGEALPAAYGGSSALHGTGLAGDRTGSQSKTAATKQASSALLCSSSSPQPISRVVLSKGTLPRSSQAACAFLQPGTPWKAWRAGVSGLRKDFISTGRSIKQKELGRKWTGWVFDVQQGLTFQGGERESPDRDIMPVWQGQATDVTHGSLDPFGNPSLLACFI